MGVVNIQEHEGHEGREENFYYPPINRQLGVLLRMYLKKLGVWLRMYFKRWIQVV